MQSTTVSLSRCSPNHFRAASYDIPQDLVYIKDLPKDELLYKLWLVAKKSQYLYYYNGDLPMLTRATAKQDLSQMIINKRDLSLTTYYGKLLYIDLSEDWLDTSIYNLYNGQRLAELVISTLQLEEMQRTVLRYYTIF